MTAHELEIVRCIEVLVERTNSMQRYIENIGCFERQFPHSLNARFEPALIELRKQNGVCEDLRQQLELLDKENNVLESLKKCAKECGLQVKVSAQHQLCSSANGATKLEQKPNVDVPLVEQETPTETDQQKDESCFLLDADEFGKIPKYMRGRLNFKDINAILSEMNDMLIHKRDLLNQPLKKLSIKDKDLVIKWREQKSACVDTAIYVMESELKKRLNEKSRLQLKTVLPCLRHVKRLKEVRDKGQLLLLPLWMFQVQTSNHEIMKHGKQDIRRIVDSRTSIRGCRERREFLVEWRAIWEPVKNVQCTPSCYDTIHVLGPKAESARKANGNLYQCDWVIERISSNGKRRYETSPYEELKTRYRDELLDYFETTLVREN